MLDHKTCIIYNIISTPASVAILFRLASSWPTPPHPQHYYHPLRPSRPYIPHPLPPNNNHIQIILPISLLHHPQSIARISIIQQLQRNNLPGSTDMEINVVVIPVSSGVVADENMKDFI
jgi:hypothetical protein